MALEHHHHNSPEESVYKLITDWKNDPPIVDTKQATEGGNALPKCKPKRRTSLPSHIDSSQIYQVLNPLIGVRELMRRARINPRNHFKENKAAVAQLSAQNHAKKQAALSAETTPPLPITQLKTKPENQTRAKNISTDFVAKNVREAAQFKTRHISSPENVSYMQKEDFGKIPPYLIKRKIQLALQADQRIEKERTKKIPPGYVLMQEEDKEEILRTLEENRGELEKKLSTLPLACNTPSKIRARSEMDQQLREIEDAIKRFSRKNVYISLND